VLVSTAQIALGTFELGKMIGQAQPEYAAPLHRLFRSFPKATYELVNTYRQLYNVTKFNCSGLGVYTVHALP
jgi:hypothetical protein